MNNNYYIIFRDTNGWLRTTVYHTPLTQILISTGNIVENKEGEMVEERVFVPCKSIDLKAKYNK